MEKGAYSLYDKLFRSTSNEVLPGRAARNTLSHYFKFNLPIMIRYSSISARWGVAAFATLMFLAQPRLLFQYLPYFGKYYDLKAPQFQPRLQ